MGGTCRPSNLSLGAAIVVKIFKMSGALSFISFKMSDQENTFASSEILVYEELMEIFWNREFYSPY